MTTLRLDKLQGRHRNYWLWAAVYSLMIVPLVVSLIYLFVHEGDASRGHLPELRRIADQTPVYPDFERVGEDYVVLKGSKASLQRQFRTSAPYAEIRKFYDAALAKAGRARPKSLRLQLLLANDIM